MMSNLIRRALRPVQKAASESAVLWPAAVATWTGGLVLYSAFTAAGLPLITAHFHCSSGAKSAADFPAGEDACAKQRGRSVAIANKMKVRSAIRGNDVIRSPAFIRSSEKLTRCFRGQSPALLLAA